MEEFRAVKDFEGYYEVSELNVRSLDRESADGRRIKGRILKQAEDKDGYLYITLYKKGIRKTRKIHSIIAEAFLGHIPNGFKLVVNHKNFNKKDNRVDNLEIISQRENANMKHIPHSSKYTGVTWDKNANKWKAAIRISNKRKHLGYFTDEYESHLAYEAALESLLK